MVFNVKILQHTVFTVWSKVQYLCEEKYTVYVLYQLFFCQIYYNTLSLSFWEQGGQNEEGQSQHFKFLLDGTEVMNYSRKALKIPKFFQVIL